MNFYKRDLDTMMEAIHVLSLRGRKPLSDYEKGLIDKCEQIYERAMIDHEKKNAYMNKYKVKKREEDPTFARSQKERERNEKKDPE